MSKQVKQVTISGEAIFCHLTSTNTAFDPEGVYDITLRVTKDKAEQMVKELAPWMDEEIKRISVINGIKQPVISKSMPWRTATDADKQPIEGYVDIRGKQNSAATIKDKKVEFKVKLYDRQNNPWDMSVPIWGGSKVSVCFRPYVWAKGSEVGFSFRLHAVQVVELVSGGSEKPEDLGFTSCEPTSTGHKNENGDIVMADGDFVPPPWICVTVGEQNNIDNRREGMKNVEVLVEHLKMHAEMIERYPKQGADFTGRVKAIRKIIEKGIVPVDQLESIIEPIKQYL